MKLKVSSIQGTCKAQVAITETLDGDASGRFSDKSEERMSCRLTGEMHSWSRRNVGAGKRLDYYLHSSSSSRHG